MKGWHFGASVPRYSWILRTGCVVIFRRWSVRVICDIDPGRTVQSAVAGATSMETIPVGRQLGSSNFERQDFHVHEVDLDGVRSLPRVAKQLKNEVQMTGDVPYCIYLDAEWSTHWPKKTSKFAEAKPTADGTRKEQRPETRCFIEPGKPSLPGQRCFPDLVAFQEELHLTELITPGAVAAELKRDAEELGPPSLAGSFQRR